MTNKMYIEAYELGQQLRKEYDDIRDMFLDERAENLIGWDFNGNRSMFLQAGFYGTEIPTWVRGWRYGNIPAEGRSKNYKDDKMEEGISMMEVTLNGETIRTKDEISALFIVADKRKVVECEGWLNTFAKGSDGEPLLFGAKEIK